MGYEELRENIYQHKNFSVGWFPGKKFNDIPGDVNGTEAIGAVDCDNAIWLEGALRKIYGYSEVQSTALNGGAAVNSLWYSDVLGEIVGNAGDKLFSEMDNATPTDITNGLTIDSSALIDWTDWEFTSTNLVIGVDGTNAPWKWNGAGGAALLGGTPPSGKWVTAWQDVLWIANTSSNQSQIDFSALGDPESWDVDDNYVFDAPITGLGVLGELLVVFMSDHIGVLSGTNNRALTKVNRYITSIGAVGGHGITNSFIGGQEVLVFHANDGIYAFDGTKRVTKLSNPIEGKYIAGASADRWNTTRLDNVTSVYVPQHDWIMTGISDASDTTNDFLLIQDMSRPFKYKEGVGVPHWPNDGHQAVNSITLSTKTSLIGEVYFGSDNGKVYKYDPSIFTRDGSGYTANYQTKILDFVSTQVVQEFNVLTEELGGIDFTMYLKEGLSEGDGNQQTVSLDEDGDLLDTTFILDSSVLGGSDFLRELIPLSDFGRYLQYKMENDNSGEQMVIMGVEMITTAIGLEPNQ